MNKIKKIKNFIEENTFFVIFQFIFIILLIMGLYYFIISIYHRNLDISYAKQIITEYYKKNNTYPIDINQLDKENLLITQDNIYIYNKDTKNLMKYITFVTGKGKVIRVVISRYDMNYNFLSCESFEEEDLK